MTTSTPEKADGLKALEIAIEKIKKTIQSFNGEFKIQMAVSTLCPRRFRMFVMMFLYILQPKVVTAMDEADLVRRMERAEIENAEVAGDDEEEEDEEGMKFDGEGEMDDEVNENDEDADE